MWKLRRKLCSDCVLADLHLTLLSVKHWRFRRSGLWVASCLMFWCFAESKLSQMLQCDAGALSPLWLSRINFKYIQLTNNSKKLAQLPVRHSPVLALCMRQWAAMTWTVAWRLAHHAHDWLLAADRNVVESRVTRTNTFVFQLVRHTNHLYSFQCIRHVWNWRKCWRSDRQASSMLYTEFKQM